MFRFKRRKKARKHKKPKQSFQLDCPVAEYQLGSVIVQTWNRESRFRRKYKVISIGRWVTNGKKMWNSKYLYPTDIEDLIEILLVHQEELTKR